MKVIVNGMITRQHKIMVNGIRQVKPQIGVQIKLNGLQKANDIKIATRLKTQSHYHKRHRTQIEDVLFDHNPFYNQLTNKLSI